MARPTKLDAEWDALRDDVEAWLDRAEKPWRDGGVIAALIKHRPAIEASVRAEAKAEAEGRIRKILKGTRWLTQLRRTLGIVR